MSSNQGAVFYPEDLSLLGQVLDRAVQSLPTKLRTSHNRAVLARRIVARAATGERDPVELELAALIDVRITAAA